MWHICKNFWDITAMNIDPQSNKSDQISSHKCYVRFCKNDPDQSPVKSGPSPSFNHPISHIAKF